MFFSGLSESGADINIIIAFEGTGYSKATMLYNTRATTGGLAVMGVFKLQTASATLWTNSTTTGTAYSGSASVSHSYKAYGSTDSGTESFTMTGDGSSTLVYAVSDNSGSYDLNTYGLLFGGATINENGTYSIMLGVFNSRSRSSFTAIEAGFENGETKAWANAVLGSVTGSLLIDHLASL